MQYLCDEMIPVSVQWQRNRKRERERKKYRFSICRHLIRYHRHHYYYQSNQQVFTVNSMFRNPANFSEKNTDKSLINIE